MSKPLKELKGLNDGIDGRYKQKELEAVLSVYGNLIYEIYKETNELRKSYFDGAVPIFVVERKLRDIANMIDSEIQDRKKEMNKLYGW